jgi:hypothetical protein
MHKRSLLFAAVTASIFALPSAAADSKASGKIVRFECGDNCYLIIKTRAGKEVTGLCVAKTCQPWNEVAKMPEKYVGRRVAVTMGAGQQIDGSGNVMGDFLSFTSIRFLKKK